VPVPAARSAILTLKKLGRRHSRKLMLTLLLVLAEYIELFSDKMSLERLLKIERQCI
jgi:hypothetical protein